MCLLQSWFYCLQQYLNISFTYLVKCFILFEFKVGNEIVESYKKAQVKFKKEKKALDEQVAYENNRANTAVQANNILREKLSRLETENQELKINMKTIQDEWFELQREHVWFTLFILLIPI